MAANSSGYLVPIRINNKGAELLSQGKIQESRVLLIRALKYTKMITVALQKRAPRRTKLVTLEYHFLTPMLTEIDSEAFMFKRPVQILEKMELEDCKAMAGDIASAIIFNVSLGFHSQGLRDSQHLKKALSGYEIALDLRKQRRRSVSKLLDLGLLNNIAEVHLERSEFESAVPYFANMAYLLKHQDNTDLGEDELDGFTTGALWGVPTCAGVA
jgi:hypothetical protein